jgi:beta-glucanase (GH16 family)
MKTIRAMLSCLAILEAAAVTGIGADAVAQPLDILGGTGAKAVQAAPTSGEVTVAPGTEPSAPGLNVSIKSGREEYPGVHLKPAAGAWDLAAYGHVRARIVNTGSKAINVALRVDGQTAEGEWVSNTETAQINPGGTGVAKVYFGYTYGNKPGAKLKPGAVSKFVIFVTRSDVEQTFRIEAIEADGPAGETPPIKPENVRIKPENGVILGPGAVLAAEQLDPNGGAQATLEGDALQVLFPEGSQPKWVSLKPKIGRWDLREAYGVVVKYRNTGTVPVALRAKVNSNGGPTDVFMPAAPVAPGAAGELEVAFAAKTSWQGIRNLTKTSWEGQKGTGARFTSDSVSSITLSAEGGTGAQAFVVTSITAGRLSPVAIPGWLGQRPPVEGEWVKTFEENFEGDRVDLSIWNVHTANHWDKRSHFSITNVIVGGGLARLRYEKKTGYHNDSLSEKQTEYATGFLDTYGKWVQRYGYFEARMKLPTAPGLWPAFWLMPDRGVAKGPQWVRADTGNGGMEFDIMEHLTRWGVNRYNIALHWDGYGKEHQQTGTQNIYYQPDAEGFITAGLLWLPGLAVFYGNGQEVARLETPRISTVQSDMMFTHVSGGWDNNALDDARLPDDFVIDYVRAWQRKDLASEVDGYVAADGTVSKTRP